MKKDINGYEELFSVTKDGKVWSKRSNRFIAQHKNNSGYLMVWFKINGKNYAKTVHRLVAYAFIENPTDKPQVNHIDGNKENNNVNNLEWTTVGENHRHAWKTGLRISTKACKKASAKNGRKSSKLNKDQIIEIRLNENNLTYKELGLKYKVVSQTIEKVINRKTYKDIE